MSGAGEQPGGPAWFSEVEAAETVADLGAAHWDDAADVVVVGYGGAGVATALEAAEQGLSVLAVDRDQGGGATAINGGVLYAGGGTAAQNEAGVSDSPQEMFNYLVQETQGVVSDETLKRFCDESVSNYDWMVGHGVKFGSRYYAKKTSYPHTSYYLYHSDSSLAPAYAARATPAPRGHRALMAGTASATGYGIALYQPLKDSAERAGVRLMTRAEARRLVVDGDGRVIGVVVLRIPPGTPAAQEHARLEALALKYTRMLPPAYPMAGPLIAIGRRFQRRADAIAHRHRVEKRLQARSGVVLAAGGFVFNPAMMQHYAAPFARGMPLGTSGDDGSGIRLGQSVGGATERMDHISAWRFINPPRAWTQGVLVDAKGERYVNEGLYGSAIGEAMVKQHGGVGWLVLDARLAREAWAQLKAKDILPFQKYPAMFAMWFGAKRARSLDELAGKCGFDGAVFAATVEAYNAAARGERPDPFDKDPADVCGLSEGPFMAIDVSISARLLPLPVLTLGGLRVDEATGAVLGEDGGPIAGLYAAGRTAIGVCSNLYVSGLAVADCIFSGRRAGRHLAGASPAGQKEAA